ncbi:MAG: SNF2-related protein [Thermomicrobiales bacterium]|nr:SNF2-related protein [Thermomicrobiales bacterium]
MAITDYHSKLFAFQLTQRVNGDNPDRLTASIMDSSVDNPHQIDAALFVFQSPLSNGVVLADEVGLGKTIEAGLVISQFWAERSRRIIITPASLRKQWVRSVEKVSSSPTMILSGATLQFSSGGTTLPPTHSCRMESVSSSDTICIQKNTSYERIFPASGASSMKRIIFARATAFVTGTSSNRSMRARCCPHCYPPQNRLDELWSLASLIDEHHFGERPAFRKRYAAPLTDNQFTSLRERILAAGATHAAATGTRVYSLH